MKTINKIDLRSSSLISKPLKWHNFLIYFVLWATSLFVIVSGLGYLFGINYGEQAESVYTQYAGLKTVDIIFGISYIGLGIFVISTRSKLARFQSNAVGCLTVCYILPLVLDLLYIFFFFAHTNVLYPADIVNWVGRFIVNMIILILTRIYYKKRSELFAE